MSDKDKYYIDGYGTKRPKDVPFWDSAKGQLVKKAGNDIKNGEYGKAAVTGLEALLTAGAIGSGFSKLPGVQKRAAMFARDGLVKDKMIVHRAIALPKGKNKPDLQYKLPAKKVRVLEHDVYPDGQVDLVASISNDILPTSYSFINRAHPYKLSEDVLKNIPMYNWESVANRIRNSFGISGAYIYLRNEKGSR